VDKMLELANKSIPEDSKVINGSTSDIIRGIQVIKLEE